MTGRARKLAAAVLLAAAVAACAAGCGRKAKPEPKWSGRPAASEYRKS